MNPEQQDTNKVADSSVCNSVDADIITEDKSENTENQDE